MSITETTKAAPPTQRDIAGNVMGNALPLIGLGIAVIANSLG